MKNENKIFQKITLTVLFIALIIIITFSWYSIYGQNKQNYSKEKKELSSSHAVINQQKNVQKDVVKDSTILVIADSTKETQLQNEKKVVNEQTSTEEKNGKWKIIIKKDVLCVYPSKKWNNTFIVYQIGRASCRERV